MWGYMFDLNSHFSDMRTCSIQMDMNTARNLIERVTNLATSFRGFRHPDYSQSAYAELLSELHEFESLTTVLDLMPYIYGCIARVALNAREIENAICYANAGLTVSEDDIDAKRTYWMVLCDCALTLDSSTIAAKYFRKANPNTSVPFRVQNIEMIDAAVQTLITKRKRPPGFRALKNNETKHREQTVRFYMRFMHCSRSTALKYYREAIRLSNAMGN